MFLGISVVFAPFLVILETASSVTSRCTGLRNQPSRGRTTFRYKYVCISLLLFVVVAISRTLFFVLYCLIGITVLLPIVL